MRERLAERRVVDMRARAAVRLARAEIALREIAARHHVYDNGIHRFPSGGREPCPGCIAADALRVASPAQPEPAKPPEGAP